MRRYRQVFEHVASIETGTADGGQGGTMRWLDRLVIELTQMFRDALECWQRTGQLCILILAVSLGLALVVWVAHS
jgi:hypothetical protein